MAFVNFKKQARLPVKTWIKRTWHVVDAREQVCPSTKVLFDCR